MDGDEFQEIGGNYQLCKLNIIYRVKFNDKKLLFNLKLITNMRMKTRRIIGVKCTRNLFIDLAKQPSRSVGRYQ